MMSRRYNTPDPAPPVMARLRKAYGDPAIAMAALCERFRMSDDRLTGIATRQGWPLRPVRFIAARRRDEAGVAA